jgi:aspartate racemase
VITIGLLGGMSCESTAQYYRLLNEEIRQRLGGLHSADCLLYSVDFAPIAAFQSEGKWDEAAEVLANGARRLEAGGAGFFVLCTNTMHKVADGVQAAVSIPLLHIAGPHRRRCHRRRAASPRIARNRVHDGTTVPS